jgi:regulator of replication initiation timing
MSNRYPVLNNRFTGSALPRLVLVQAVVAVLALVVLVVVGAKIGPLLEEKAQLENDILSYKQEVSELKIKMARNRAQFAGMKIELEDARERLAETFEMSRFEHPVDPVDLKAIFSRYPKQARALELMLEMQQQGVGWQLGGQSPEVGFDSPSFSAYILNELGVLESSGEQSVSLLSRSRQLFSQLEPIDKPGIGDLVFYPAGYALFYFLDHKQKPFVIGMTPAGIVALEPDFAKVIGYRKSGLAN